MDITIDLDQGQETSLELGQWEDLEYLLGLLNGAWEAVEYRLEPVEGKKNMFLFIEDPVQSDEYECGIVMKEGKKAMAFSPAVHAMVMGAYQRYVQDFGDPMEEEA